jgi:hypothetical protein
VNYVDGKLMTDCPGLTEDDMRDLDEYVTKAAKIFLKNSDSYHSLNEYERTMKLQRFKELYLRADYLGIEFEMSKIPYESNEVVMARFDKAGKK